ncbi:MAG: chromate transporter, partial [Clostridia bacterium]|nr:chromate transporter [Clostridia bacterium]
MILLELFLSFLKIGAFTFGGGYAMLPLIMETVVSKGWMSEEALIDFVAVAESTPGPFAINIATYVGSEMGGFFGAVCATLGVVLPSFVIILIVAKCYEKFRKSKLVSGAMTGLKPVVVGLIGAAILSIGVKALGLSSFAFSLSFGLSLLFSLIILVPCLVMA